MYNKQAHSAQNPRKKEIPFKLYQEQNIKQKFMIRNAISKHENKITCNMRNGQNKTIKIWNNIKKLKGASTVRKNIHDII